MKKEVLFAIVIGFALGLVITFGIWTANKSLTQTTSQQEAPPEETELQPNPTLVPQHSLTISSPEDNLVSSEEEIEVSGQTSAEAVVVILYPGGEEIIQADQQGKFSTQITLEGGENQITVLAYDQEENETSQTLTVVYSTAEI